MALPAMSDVFGIPDPTKIVGYERPPRWSGKRRAMARIRISQLRLLAQMADELAYGFEDGPGPNDEAESLERELRWVESRKPRPIFASRPMTDAENRIVDEIFKSSTLVQILKGTKNA